MDCNCSSFSYFFNKLYACLPFDWCGTIFGTDFCCGKLVDISAGWEFLFACCSDRCWLVESNIAIELLTKPRLSVSNFP
jgi:hypothetical protein